MQIKVQRHKTDEWLPREWGRVGTNGKRADGIIHFEW